MNDQSRSHRRRLMREAEGFVELAVLFDDCFPLEQNLKTKLADRCLATLAEVRPADRNKATYLYLEGQAHRLAERYEPAIESLEAAWELDSTNIHTCLALGWCFKRTGHVGLAIESLQKALTIDRNSGIVHYNLACYLALLHQTKMAVIHLSTALDLEQGFRDYVASEADFDSIRSDPEFQALVTVIV